MDYRIEINEIKLKEIQIEDNYLDNCWICGNKFYHKFKQKTPRCSACSIFAKCIMCGKEFEKVSHLERIYYNLTQGKDLNLCCSSNCARKYTGLIAKNKIGSLGVCKKCGLKKKIVSLNQYCEDCQREVNILIGTKSSKIMADKIGKIGICSTCSLEKEINNIFGQCKDCNGKASTSGGIAMASNIGKILKCKGCKLEKKIISTSGLCQECAINSSKNAGLSASSKIGKIGICSECGLEKEIVSVTHKCKECQMKTWIHNGEITGNIRKNMIGKELECANCGKIKTIINVACLCMECSAKFNLPVPNFIPEKLQSCGHTCQSVLSNGEYICWKCYKEDYIKNIKTTEIEDFVKIPNEKPSTISEMNLGNIFLTLDNKQKPKLLSKNYLLNSLLYVGNLNIKDLSLKLNIPYGTKTNFMPEKLQPCGHISKSVLSHGEYVCWKCYVKEFENRIQDSNIEDFVKIPNEKHSIVSEMHLGNTFLTLDEEVNPIKLSKNYDINSLLYKGHLSIQELSTKLNIPYGSRTNFMSKKLQTCGHISKSVLSNGEYVCWQCYVKEFENRLPSQNLILDRRIPTFLNQTETNSIPGNRFEQYLVEQNIQWFTYIKFDINNKPLVVGKSGSLLVNSNGSDLSFDLNIDGGPARQLLIETKSNWNRENIEIKLFKNEIDALEYEFKISNSIYIFNS